MLTSELVHDCDLVPDATQGPAMHDGTCAIKRNRRFRRNVLE